MSSSNLYYYLPSSSFSQTHLLSHGKASRPLQRSGYSFGSFAGEHTLSYSSTFVPTSRPFSPSIITSQMEPTQFPTTQHFLMSYSTCYNSLYVSNLKSSTHLTISSTYSKSFHSQTPTSHKPFSTPNCHHYSLFFSSSRITNLSPNTRQSALSSPPIHVTASSSSAHRLSHLLFSESLKYQHSTRFSVSTFISLVPTQFPTRSPLEGDILFSSASSDLTSNHPSQQHSPSPVQNPSPNQLWSPTSAPINSTHVTPTHAPTINGISSTLPSYSPSIESISTTISPSMSTVDNITVVSPTPAPRIDAPSVMARIPTYSPIPHPPSVRQPTIFDTPSGGNSDGSWDYDTTDMNATSSGAAVKLQYLSFLYPFVANILFQIHVYTSIE